jgi:hypothetical protein
MPLLCGSSVTTQRPRMSVFTAPLPTLNGMSWPLWCSFSLGELPPILAMPGSQPSATARPLDGMCWTLQGQVCPAGRKPLVVATTSLMPST